MAPPPPPVAPNFDILPHSVTLTRTGAGPVSTPVDVINIVLNVGPGHSTFWSNGDATDSTDLVVNLANGQTLSGVLFATVTDTGNGASATGAMSWTAISNAG